MRGWLLIRLRSRCLDRRRSAHSTRVVPVADVRDVERPEAPEEAVDLAPDRARVPGGGLRDRLVASARAERFAPFARRLAQITGLDEAGARAALALTGGGWELTPWAGCELLHFAGGPSTAGADVRFVRLQPGCRFPMHEHPSEEVLILLGALREEADGTIRRAGDRFTLTGAHAFSALPGEPLIYAVVVYGVRFLE